MAGRPARWGFVVGGLLAVSACATGTQQVTLASTNAASPASSTTPSSTTPSSTTPSSTSTPPSTTPSDTRPQQRRTAERAIREWLADHGDEVFGGDNDPYRGTCPEESTTYGFLCSSMDEQLGELAIHSVGVYGTDWGADLLLRSDAAGWVVVDGEGWPEPPLGTGPPWSPLTAIGQWWRERPDHPYGEDAAHLRRCSDATGGVSNAQLCSTLERDGDARRVYSSGLAGQPPDVYLLLDRDPSTYVWRVTDSAPVEDGDTAPPPAW